jgi:hypothetical protein
MDKYSGREQWPGCGGRPLLEIPADNFVLYWYTDGYVHSMNIHIHHVPISDLVRLMQSVYAVYRSNYDWGWRFSVTATMAQLELDTAPLPQVERRLYHIGRWPLKSVAWAYFPT